MSAPRQLPLRPSLDHLKNEAKALLRAYSTGAADAVARVRSVLGDCGDIKLLDAQRVIAREYGFSKWSDLRAHVRTRIEAIGATPAEPSRRPLTTRTFVAIAIARGIAAAYGHADLGMGHIALGVLREGENAAVGALHRAGVPLRELRRALERALPPGVTPRPGLTSLGTSSAETALLERAATEANGRGVEFVANEHLVLALLRDRESPTSEIFARHGISYNLFAQHLDAVLHPNG